MASGLYRRLENVCCSVEPELGNEWANSAKRVYRSVSAGSHSMKALGEKVYIVGRGNIKMALAGPAVTATRLLKVIRLRRHTSWTSCK